jgi:hypothetical protein
MQPGTLLPPLYPILVELLQPAKVSTNSVRTRLQRLLKKTPDLIKDIEASGIPPLPPEHLLAPFSPPFTFSCSCSCSCFCSSSSYVV